MIGGHLKERSQLKLKPVLRKERIKENHPTVLFFIYSFFLLNEYLNCLNDHLIFLPPPRNPNNQLKIKGNVKENENKRINDGKNVGT